MMRIVSTNAIAFVLGISIGVGVHSFIARRYTHECFCLTTTIADNVRGVTINSVPSLDFPAALKKRGPTRGAVRLIATLDADGSIRSVRPYPMVPFGVSESAAGSGEFADVTPFQREWRFADSLPYGLTELAIQQVSKISYKPKTRNGRPESQRVFVLTEFNYTEAWYAVGCSEIAVTIVDDTGVVWSGNTWVHGNRGCAYI